MPQATHTDYARTHAIRRAWQRFGIACGLPDLKQAEQNIRNGKFTLVTVVNGNRIAVEVELKEKTVVAIFDKDLDCIVTVFPDKRWALPNAPAQPVVEQTPQTYTVPKFNIQENIRRNNPEPTPAVTNKRNMFYSWTVQATNSFKEVRRNYPAAHVDRLRQIFSYQGHSSVWRKYTVDAEEMSYRLLHFSDIESTFVLITNDTKMELRNIFMLKDFISKFESFASGLKKKDTSVVGCPQLWLSKTNYNNIRVIFARGTKEAKLDAIPIANIDCPLEHLTYLFDDQKAVNIIFNNARSKKINLLDFDQAKIRVMDGSNMTGYAVLDIKPLYEQWKIFLQN